MISLKLEGAMSWAKRPCTANKYKVVRSVSLKTPESLKRQI